MKLKRRILSIALSAAMTLSVATTAHAATSEWKLPNLPLSISDYGNVMKIAAHGSATTSALYLGYNLTTYRSDDMGREVKGDVAEDKLNSAKKSVAMAAFGTNLNKRPDPYISNYLYNLNADVNGGQKTEDQVYLTTGGLAPWNPDVNIIDELGTSYSLARRPDILLGTGRSDYTGTRYDSMIADLPENKNEDSSDDYDPIQIAYSCDTMYDLSDTMYNLANQAKKLGKESRYGDPVAIAEKYEAMLKGMQLYVRSQIDAGKVKEKTVAVISCGSSRGTSYSEDTDGDGIDDKFKLNPNSPQTNFSRTHDWLQNVTKDAAAYVDGGRDYITAEEIAKYCDIVYVQGLQGVTSPTADELYNNIKTESGVKDLELECFVANPSTVFAIGQSNSVNNIEGVPLTIGYAYPELINPVYGDMYIYQNFWHVDDQYLTQLANNNFASASLPEGINRSGDGYSEKAIQGIINQGLRYGKENSDKINNPKLADFTLNVDEFISANPGDEPQSPAKQELNANNVTMQTKAVYTGKAIKPAVSVRGLKANNDYTVAYSNNVKCGNATVTITGKGAYTGKVVKHFAIVPAKSTISSAKSGSKKVTVTIKSQKSSGVTGYQISYKLTSAKSYKNVYTTSTKKVISKLKKGKKYHIKVRAYKTISGSKNFGAYSKVKTVKVK